LTEPTLLEMSGLGVNQELWLCVVGRVEQYVSPRYDLR
jgi:hypothetical protein